MAESYVVIWNGRDPLTAFPEKDWAVLDRNEEIYWPPAVVLDWRHLSNGGGWGVIAIGGNLRAWMRLRRLRSGAVNLRLKKRIINGERHNNRLIGERARNVTLQEQDILEIRQLYNAGGISFNKLSKRFGVSTPTIAQIVNGDTWKHLPLTPS